MVICETIVNPSISQRILRPIESREFVEPVLTICATRGLVITPELLVFKPLSSKDFAQLVKRIRDFGMRRIDCFIHRFKVLFGYKCV